MTSSESPTPDPDPLPPPPPPPPPAPESSSSTVRTPAGWYPAPSGAPGVLQWWDGHRWTPTTNQAQHLANVYPQQSFPTSAVTKSPKQTNHVLHLILSVLTCGLWLPVWAIVWWINTMSRDKSVTRYR